MAIETTSASRVIFLKENVILEQTLEDIRNSTLSTLSKKTKKANSEYIDGYLDGTRDMINEFFEHF